MSTYWCYRRFCKMQRDLRIVRIGHPALEMEFAFTPSWPELLTSLVRLSGWLPDMSPACAEGSLIEAARNGLRLIRQRKVGVQAWIGEGVAVRECVARERAAAWN